MTRPPPPPPRHHPPSPPPPPPPPRAAPARKRGLPGRLLATAVLLAAMLPPPPLHTAARALDWARMEISQRAEPGEPLPPYQFTFTNTGSTPVSITNIRASCGCLASEPDRETCAPGESGSITIRFDRAGLAGEVARTVAVTTDEPGRKTPYELTLRAELPEPLTIAPRLVFWKSGAPALTKSIDLKINHPEPVEITRASCNRDDIEVALVTLERGRHYRLDITPRDTAAPRLAIIALQTAAPLPAGSPLTAYAQIR